MVGMSAVGMLIASAVPAGILMGPMLCGVYLTLFKLRRGEPIEFALLFKGFDYFKASLIATLLHVLPILAIVIPAYLLFYVAFILSTVAQGGEPNPGAALGVLAMFAIFWLVMIVVIIFMSLGFTFVYPLIVDRNLGAIDAIKLSFKAALANFWGLLLLMLCTGLLVIVGALLCYVGMFLAFPIQYAAIAIAYERVFGLMDGRLNSPDLPPPPPSF